MDKETYIDFAVTMYLKRYGQRAEQIRGVEIVLGNSREEVYKKRIELTKDEILKKVLIAGKDKFISHDGCYIHPQGDEDYIMILHWREDGGQLLAYDYCHELSHIIIFDEYMRLVPGADVLSFYTNMQLFLWNEYTARYMSTRVLLDWFELEKTKDETRQFFYSTIQEFKNRAISNGYESYDGMQFMGYVMAFRDHEIIMDKDVRELLESDENIQICNKYHSIKNVEHFQ